MNGPVSSVSLRIDSVAPSPEERDLLWRGLHAALEHIPEVRERLHLLALRVRDLNDGMDGFIERQTAAVCPDCSEVCCINRHAFHSRADLLYLSLLGESLPVYDDACTLTAPCQFLASRGCIAPRSLRPHRCNWYFCDALVRHMEENCPAESRAFSRLFRELVDTRNRMVEEFPNSLSPGSSVDKTAPGTPA